MDPNSQASGFNPDQNPFEGIMNQGGGMPQGQPMMAQGQAMPQPGMMPGMVENPNSPELPGQTGDSSKPLIAAVKALHDYIAMSTDIRTQNLIRNLITAITQLISKDQAMGAKNAEALSGQKPGLPTPPSIGQ